MVWLKKTVLVAAVSLSGIAQAQNTTSSDLSTESTTLAFTNSSSTVSSTSSSLSSTSGTVSLTSTESESSTSAGSTPSSTGGSAGVSVTPSQSSTGGVGGSSSAAAGSSSAPAGSSNAPGGGSSSAAAGSSAGGGAASTPASSGGSNPSTVQSASASASTSTTPSNSISVLSTSPQAFNNFLSIQLGEAIVSTIIVNGQSVDYVIISRGCRGVPAGQSPFSDGTGPESGSTFTPATCAGTCAGKRFSMSGTQRGICNCGNTLRTDLPLIDPSQCRASNQAKRQTGTYDPVPIAQGIPASQVALQQASVTLSQSSLPVVAVNTLPPGASVPASTAPGGSSAASSAASAASAASVASASSAASAGVTSASSAAAASSTDFVLAIVGGLAPSSSVSRSSASSSASSSRASSASSSSAASSSASSSRASSSSAASSSPATTLPTSSLSITSAPISTPFTSSTFNFANTTSLLPQKRAILKRKIEELAKRQNGVTTYVGKQGNPNPTNCGQASVFRLGASGTLFIDNVAFGVNPGVPFIPLRAGQTGSIVATFTATAGGGFAWTNSQFSGGQAGFCQDNTGQIYATFGNTAVASNLPTGGCTTVSFNVVPNSQCVGGSTVAASSTPPVVNPSTTLPTTGVVTTPVNPTTGVPTGVTTIVGPSGTTIVGPSGTTIIGPSGTSVVGPSGTGTGATATTSGAVTTVAPNPGTIGDYAALGCFGSNSGFPSFILVKQDNALTIDSCIAACGGSKLIGVFDTDCYCGSFIDNSQTQQVSENQCSTQCPGNALQRCGGRSSVAKRQNVPVGVLLSVYVRIDAGSISTVVSVSVSAGVDTTASFTFTTVVTNPGVTGVPSQTPNVVGTLTLPPGLYTEGQPTPTGEFCRITTGSWYIGSTTLLPFPLPTA